MSVPFEEYNDLAADGWTPIQLLKLRLQAVTGLSRFRQRLLCEDRIVRDDDVLELPIVLYLVLLSMSGPSEAMLDRVIAGLRADDAGVVDEFLHQPHDPNEEAGGLTCLCLAARYGSLSSAKLLLEARAMLDKADSLSAWAPLHWASASGHAEFTRWLLQSRADIRKAEENGRLLLHSVCLFGHVEVADIFLEAGVDVNMEDGEGRTPLTVSVSFGQVQMVQLLLERGVDVNRVSSQGYPPLHMACTGGPLDVARLLVQRRADPNLRFRGLTALEIASAAGQPDLVRLLSEAIEARGAGREIKRRRWMKGPP